MIYGVDIGEILATFGIYMAKFFVGPFFSCKCLEIGDTISALNDPKIEKLY